MGPSKLARHASFISVQGEIVALFFLGGGVLLYSSSSDAELELESSRSFCNWAALRFLASRQYMSDRES